MGREKYNLSESWRRLDWERAQITEEERLEIEWQQLKEEKRRMAWDRSQFEEEKNRHNYENEYEKWQLRRGEQESAWLQREIRSLKRRVFQHER